MEKKRVAQYKIIEDELRESIRMGQYKQGDMIPTEAELMIGYGVSRVTVRKALDPLVAQGMLQRVAGAGTFVKNTFVKEHVPILRGFTDEITEMGMQPTSKVITFELMKVPDRLYRTLGIGKDEMVYYIQRIRYADGIPFVLETTHMSVRLYPDMSLKILNGSKYHYVEDTLGLKIAYSEHTVTPLLPSEEIAELFGLSPRQPIIRAANTTFLENGQVLDYTELTYNSPKYQLRYIKQ